MSETKATENFYDYGIPFLFVTCVGYGLGCGGRCGHCSGKYIGYRREYDQVCHPGIWREDFR